MAYLGSTQASSVANPPVMMYGGMGAGADVRIATGSTGLYISNNFGLGLTTGSPTPGRGFGQQMWMYTSTHMAGEWYAADFFSDAAQLGMRPGDLLWVVGNKTTGGSSVYLSLATVADISTAGAATISTQSVISSSVNAAAANGTPQ